MTNSERNRKYYYGLSPEKRAELIRKSTERRREARRRKRLGLPPPPRPAKKVKSTRIGKCRTCGKEFVISLRRHYCSEACQLKAKALRGTEEARRRSAAKFAALPPKRCIYCGKEFKPLTLFAYRNAKFCSPTCANRHRFYPTLAACEAAKAARQAAAEARQAAAEARREKDSFGLTMAERNAVIRAQCGSRDELWAASQHWTPAQRKFAKARWAELHPTTFFTMSGKY